MQRIACHRVVPNNGPVHLTRYPQWVTVLFAYPGTKLLARTKFTKIYKRVGRYPSKLLPPGTDTETTGYPWNNTMDPEPFILPRQLLLLPVGKV